VVDGSRNTGDLATMEELLPEAAAQLHDLAHRVEGRFADLCEIEFTVESGRLWLLQARPGQRSPRAEVVTAVELAEAGAISRAEALERVDRERIDGMRQPALDGSRLDPASVLAVGVGVSPGVAAGRIAFDNESCAALAEAGDPVILVRAQTSPEDLEGIIACTGLLTLRGGKTSHAAVVTRGLGRPCVCGAEELELDVRGGTLRAGEVALSAGDTISIDGEGGHVILSEAPLAESPPIPQLETYLRWSAEGEEAT
jgi:pyruvate,orthophosphate dikinase